jgi:mannose-6-phosphate isomerase-like protein (cupin superfamily)
MIAIDRERTLMRGLTIGLLLLGSTAALLAQDKPALPATDVTAKDVAAFLKALPRNDISDKAIRIVNVGGYQVGIYGVFRPKSMASDAIAHETSTSEIYYMLEGSATLVTGGIIAGKGGRLTASTGPRGDRIEGGVSRKVVPGDIIVIPGRTPHWWSSLDGDIQYLIFRPDPDSKLTMR